MCQKQNKKVSNELHLNYDYFLEGVRLEAGAEGTHLISEMITFML